MVKIELSKEIEEEHLLYFEEIILPLLKNLPQHKKLAFEHEKFAQYCNDNFVSIAIGKPKVLKELIQEVDEKFPKMKSELLNKGKKRKCKENENEKTNTYSQNLQKCFGYKLFTDNIKLEDYFKNRAKYLSSPSGQWITSNYNKNMTRYVHDAIREIFEDYQNEENGKLLLTNDVKKLVKTKGFSVTLANYNKIKQEFLPWSAYKLALKNNITVCPYCNRQYITPVFSDNGKVRGEFDHFYPKNKYPYLSMSLYNLIPSCSVCNSSLKGQKEFSIHDIHPYEENYNDLFDFYINPVDQANPRVEIEIHGKKEKETEKYLNMFQIEALYNYHSNQGIEMFEKSVIYSDSYVEELLKNNPEIFQTEEELKALIYGYILDEKDIGKEAFGKLRRDVAKQLGLIE
ncbi:MAG: hypothetical protein R3Y63_05830 [Eubacteriales bacterium]